MSKKDGFFSRMDIALTFDDVRLKTRYSECLPHEVSVKSMFSRNIRLNIPIVSAAMDTVTESKMAITLAKCGGIGVLHKNISPELQAKMVARVKHHLHGLITDPVCVREESSIEDILRMCQKKGFTFHSFPVVDEKGLLKGILTNNDFTFCDNFSLPANMVMTQNPVTGTPNTSLEKAYEIMRTHKVKALPLLSPEKKVLGLYVFGDLRRTMSQNSQEYNVASNGQLRVAAAIETGESALLRMEALVGQKVDAVVIDTAHANSDRVQWTLREAKHRFPDVDVVVGNVTEPDAVSKLLSLGADGIKVGQGPGSICTTRIVAGIGCPQVTAIYQCAKAAEGSGVPICADGGLRYSGDITIAIGAGAHCVMMGSMLAGTDEAPGDRVYVEGRPYKDYRGMGSIGAMEKSKSARDRYGQDDVEKDKLVPEGVEGQTLYKGKLSEVLHQYVGGLRSGMGYMGVRTIEELQEEADFYRISSGGKRESHTHDVVIIKQPPNYRSE